MDPQNKQIDKYQIIIIGAGAAGIGAATKLKNQNVPYIILQARDRIGGRLLTHMIDQTPIDLGGSWIHSYGTQNPIKPYVKKFKIEQVVLSKRKIGRVFYDGEEGKQFDQNTLEVAYCNNSCYYKIAQKKLAKSNTDLSLYEATKQFMTTQKQKDKFTPSERRCLQLLINMKQHYNASSTVEQSATHYQFSIDEGGDFTPCGGYGCLINQISKSIQANVSFNKVIKQINYLNDKVIVECTDGSKYQSKKIISSLPLGVLKSGKVSFNPQLPVEYQQSIKKLGMGLMNKIIVSFQQNFWGQMSWISVGFNQRGKFSHIYNLSRKDKNMLCCFITDDFARKTENLTDQVILQQFLQVLQKLFKVKQIKVKDYKITRWGKEEHSLGSYTYFHVGSSPQDCYQLRKSINNTLWIVGQHCYAEHIGTAHGAFKTGEWAALQVLKSLKWVNPIYKQPKQYIKQKAPIKKLNK